MLELTALRVGLLADDVLVTVVLLVTVLLFGLRTVVVFRVTEVPLLGRTRVDDRFTVALLVFPLRTALLLFVLLTAAL
ncbi:Putative membrane protein [Zobellia galactanivorans]|uniref:Putative membrane protein n=1 Tax=Zobellia galactanivorans (strain DSM 12802 / CCUG 47099 / CIP 106680 / NCIMB 13871 / Dsij) TaxID=63186 RepID=G0L2U3_ZOBGA|nr:Putative membrane protein [Zobellia galactanivorans]